MALQHNRTMVRPQENYRMTERPREDGGMTKRPREDGEDAGRRRDDVPCGGAVAEGVDHVPDAIVPPSKRTF